MKTFDQYLLEKNATYSYGCVMLDLTDKSINNQLITQFIKILQQQIPDNELYIDKKDPEKFGKETEYHCTLLFGLFPEVTEEDVKRLTTEWAPVDLKMTGISIFTNPDKDYDVVKLDVDPKTLKKYNKDLQKFPFASDFPDYKPHVTLAFVKKGEGSKYELKFDEPLIATDLTNITYSFADKTKKKVHYKLVFKADSK